MARATRSFKLRLSPAGMDVFIDSHCHLIRATRCLIPWGTTLHVAVDHLATVPTETIALRLLEIQGHGLTGTEEHHVGAPHRLCDIASHIAARVDVAAPDVGQPALGMIYILALQELVRADAVQLRAAFDRTRRSVRQTSD